MSIVRVGLAETKGFAEGYEAIFGKKTEEAKPASARAEKPQSADKAKKTKKKTKKK